jgi:TRAP-type mannitol/chloroaromatic compound transport system substrate-binding protein
VKCARLRRGRRRAGRHGRDGHTAPYYFFGKDPTFALGCAIPFGLNSRQMTAWMYEGNGMKLMREFYAKYNIVNFPAATPVRRWAAGGARKSSRWPT